MGYVKPGDCAASMISLCFKYSIHPGDSVVMISDNELLLPYFSKAHQDGIELYLIHTSSILKHVKSSIPWLGTCDKLNLPEVKVSKPQHPHVFFAPASAAAASVQLPLYDDSRMPYPAVVQPPCYEDALTMAPASVVIEQPPCYVNFDKEIIQQEEIMILGHVKWFNESKGFGFITGNDGIDYFVRYREVQCDGFQTLHENEIVSFIPHKGELEGTPLHVKNTARKVIRLEFEPEASPVP